MDTLLLSQGDTNTMLASLTGFLVVAGVIGLLTTLLFIGIAVYWLIRKWKLEKAIFSMQEDLAAIRAHLTTEQSPTQETPQDVRPPISK